MDLEGDVFTYKAASDGKVSELNKMVVREVLHLKLAVPFFWLRIYQKL